MATVGMRHRESHRNPIYAIAFNHVDASLAHTFATVGANRATVYRLDDPSTNGGEKEVHLPEGRKRGRACRALTTLQAYCDGDEDENFYCCAWGVEKADSSPEGSIGSLLAIGGENRHIKVLDCCVGGVRCVLPGHGYAINEVKFHPHIHELLLSASEDESIRLWHVHAAVCLATFCGDQGHRGAVVAIDVRPDGDAFASCSVDGTVKVWSLKTPAILGRAAQTKEELSQRAATAPLPEVPVVAREESEEAADECEGGAGSAEGRGASGGPAGALSARPPLVCQYPETTCRVHYDSSTDFSYWVDCVRYVGDSLLLTRCSQQGLALLWQLEATSGGHGHGGPASGGDGSGFRVLREFRTGGDLGIWYLRFALDAARSCLAMGNTRGEVLVWPLLGAGAPHDSAHASANGKRKLAVDGASAEPSEASVDVKAVKPCTTLRVADVSADNSKQAKKGKDGKGSKSGGASEEGPTVRCTAVSNDGRCILGGCDDGSLCVWELPPNCI